MDTLGRGHLTIPYRRLTASTLCLYLNGDSGYVLFPLYRSRFCGLNATARVVFAVVLGSFVSSLRSGVATAGAAPTAARSRS